MTETQSISIPLEAVRQIVAKAEQMTGGFYSHDANGLLDACKAIVADKQELLDKIEELRDEILDLELQECDCDCDCDDSDGAISTDEFENLKRMVGSLSGRVEHIEKKAMEAAAK